MPETTIQEPVPIQEPTPVTSAELYDVVNAINQQTYQMQLNNQDVQTDFENLQKFLTDLKTFLEQQQPTDEEIANDTALTETQQATLDTISTDIRTLNTNLVAMTEEMPKEKIVVEGFYFISLSVVVGLAIYMFWNQLSKW